MAKKEINSDISVDGQIMLTNVPNGTGNFLTYNLVNKTISQRTNAEVISDLGLITASNIASAYYTKTESDAKFVPYTGATQNLLLGDNLLKAKGFYSSDNLTKLIANSRDFWILHSKILVSVSNTGTGASMGDIYLDIFRYAGQSFKLILSSFKYNYNWNSPTVYLSHGNIDSISSIRLLKESNAKLWVEINFTSAASGGKVVIGDSLRGSGFLNDYAIFVESEVDTTSFTQSSNIPVTSIINKASTANQLTTARTINGTSFDGSANIVTANWGTARNINIGGVSKSVNGSTDVSWSLPELNLYGKNDFADPATTLNLTDFSGSDRVNLVPNEWIDVALDSVGINTSFIPILEVSDDGTTWTQVTSITDMFKFFDGGNSLISITQNYFRFTFRTTDAYHSRDYIGFRTQSLSPGPVINSFYESSQNGTTWTNRSTGNTNNVTNVYNTTLFKTTPQGNASYHRITVNKISGGNVNLAQIMYLTRASAFVSKYRNAYAKVSNYHKTYNVGNYLGTTYISGGAQKPTYFKAGSIQGNMLNGGNHLPSTNLGWSDVLWLSTYNGTDVKTSTAIWSSKSSNKIGFTKQAYDSADWGTFYEFWHSGNFNPSNYSLGTHTHTFASLTSKPTTLSGYGITDAVSQAYLQGITISNTGGGAWIDMPIGQYSAIGSGGQGQDAWIARAFTSGQFLSNASAGDIIQRNLNGKIMWGNASSVAGMYLENNILNLINVPKVNGNNVALENQIGSANITIKGVNSLTGNGTFNTNQNFAQSINLDLTQTTKDNIELGVNASSWGNHASQGYLTSASLTGYATQTYVQNTFATIGSLNNYVDRTTAQNVGGEKTMTSTTRWIKDGDATTNSFGIIGSGNTNFDIGTLNDKNVVIYRNSSQKIVIGDTATTFNNMIHTTNDGNSTQWFEAYNQVQSAVKVNQEFDSTNTGNGLAITDDYFGDESGLTDINLENIVAGKRNGNYHYGSSVGGPGGMVVDPVTGHMGYGGVMPLPAGSKPHYFNGDIVVTNNIYSKLSNGGQDLFSAGGSLVSTEKEITQDNGFLRFVPFTKYLGGTSNTIDTDSQNVFVALRDGGTLTMVEHYPNQDITICNVSGISANFIINNTPVSVGIPLKSTAKFRVTEDGLIFLTEIVSGTASLLN